MQWLGTACGHKALLYYAMLRGNDYDGHKGMSGVGIKTAWDILRYLFITAGYADNWTPALLVQAVLEKGGLLDQEILR